MMRRCVFPYNAYREVLSHRTRITTYVTTSHATSSGQLTEQSSSVHCTLHVTTYESGATIWAGVYTHFVIIRRSDALPTHINGNRTNVFFADSVRLISVETHTHCIKFNHAVFLSIYTVSQKMVCRTLAITLSNLNRFYKFLHCWKAYKICYKYNITRLTLDMCLHHLRK